MWMDYESEMGALSSLTAIKNFAMLALASRQARTARLRACSFSQGSEKRNSSLSRFSWRLNLRFIQPKKFRDMIRRGDARIDHEGSGNPAS